MPASIGLFVLATVLFTGACGRPGTGFLVFRQTSDHAGHVYLISNRHVAFGWCGGGKSPGDMKMVYTKLDADSNAVLDTIEIPLKMQDGSDRWRVHPSPDTDLVAIDVSFAFLNPAYHYTFIDEAMIADSSILKQAEASLGDEILIVSYPEIYTDSLHRVTPISAVVRQGILATLPGKEYRERYKDGRTTTYRGFLVDGMVVPRSSGSAVVFKPVMGRWENDKWIANRYLDPFVLGVITETRFSVAASETERYKMSFAGLGLALDAQMIKETIDLFFK